MASSGNNNRNNNDQEEDDPWADIFDRAEGKITPGKNDDEEHATSATAAATARRPKVLHHVTKTSSQADEKRRNNGNYDNDNARFQKYLNERSAFQTQLRLEDGGIVLKESLSASTTTSSANTSTAACQGWKGAAEEGGLKNKNKKLASSCCQSCGRSSFCHRAATAVDVDNNSEHHVFAPLQLYCLLRNIRHVTILFLTTTATTRSRTAETTSKILNGQDDDDDNADFVGWPLLDECSRIVAALLHQPEVAISLQTKLATLQALLHQQKQQQGAFKKRKTQTTTNQNKNNSSSAMSVQQRQQQQREEAIRIMMQCDECYYQLYYLEITRQLTGGVFSSSQHNRRRGGNQGGRRRSNYTPHPTVYFGEGFMMMNETSYNNTRNSNTIQHYLDSARDLISSWNNSLDDDASVVARFQLNFEQQYNQQQPPSVASALGKSSTYMMDALSALHYIRFLETITFFDVPNDTSWLSSSSTKAPSSSLLSKRKGSSSSSSSLTAPPPAPALLMEWRDSCRDFLTHLYAYATLPPDLISRILQTCRQEKIQNIIEVGAGTGYVAHLFNVQQKGNGHDMIGVEACDLLPTTPPSSSAVAAVTSTTTRMNEYHGYTPPFTHVAKASCTQALQNNNNNMNSKTALLLCYPPPDSSMALDAVQMFCKFANNSRGSNNNSSSGTKKKRRRRRRCDNDDANAAPRDTATTVTSSGAAAGSLVIYIGEFQGLTGTRDLERYLMKNFNCIARHACPTWGTDATSVTIWKVRKHALSSSLLSSPSLLIPCHYCQEKPATKRLRCIRHLEYCSKICFQADCQSGVVYQHAKCSRLYFGGGGGGGVTTGGGSGTGGAANDTTADDNMSTTTSCCALDFDNNKQHFLDLTY